jgi:hypothetical protein
MHWGADAAVRDPHLLRKQVQILVCVVIVV